MSESLHRQLDALGIKDWRVRALVHVMIDIGKVTSLECQIPDCKADSRSFLPHGPGRGNREGRRLHIDHILPRSKGGDDRMSNLRIAHGTCNMTVFKRPPMSDEERNRRSEGRKRFLESGDQAKWRESLKQRKPGWNKKTSPDDKRGGRRG